MNFDDKYRLRLRPKTSPFVQKTQTENGQYCDEGSYHKESIYNINITNSEEAIPEGVHHVQDRV